MNRPVAATFLVALLLLVGARSTAAAAQLEVKVFTGGDDLRGNCWANLTIKLKDHDPRTFEAFVRGLRGNSVAQVDLDYPELIDPNQVEYFQIQHVSQEGPFETRDNWNMDLIELAMKFGRFPIVIGKHGPHRFTGASALLTFYPPR
ncbi:hypothetical protein [Sorangium sp. So ce861]|uniref:hypothetical protein n=1 Tax=Sorangium sp. So ce861 TaxID=3133323 RepID=UPI003F604DB9